VPPELQERVALFLHSIHHPGVKATKRLVAARFCWPFLAKQVAALARACLFCQRGKVHQHVHLQPAAIPVPIAASPTCTWIWSAPCLPPAGFNTCSQ
jgi:hypothetical protein